MTHYRIPANKWVFRYSSDHPFELEREAFRTTREVTYTTDDVLPSDPSPTRERSIKGFDFRLPKSALPWKWIFIATIDVFISDQPFAYDSYK